jgi:hypothetical protein
MWQLTQQLGNLVKQPAQKQYDEQNAADAAARRAAKQSALDKVSTATSQVRTTPLSMEGPVRTESTDTPLNVAATGDAYKAKTNGPTGPLAEYDYMRGKVTEQANQANQGAQDAIKRRFAAMGGLNSGSFVKQAQLQNESSDQKRMDALQGVNMQEAQTRRAMDEAFKERESQKEFQSQEALQGRKYSAQESAYGRQLQSQEAAKSRNLSAQQAQLQRNMSKEMFNADQEFKNAVFKADSASKLALLDQSFDQMELDRETTQFNKEQAVKESNKIGIFGM